MGFLDTENLIKKIDKTGMLQNIEELADQIDGAWKKLVNFAVPTPYIKAENILILGMDSSAIAGDLVKDLAESESNVPVTILRDYNIPKYVDHHSLVIAVSYSGNTEETLTAFEQAAEKGAKLLAISTGGKLASLCRKYRAPMFVIEYGAMPRAAFGYTFIPVLGIFSKLGFVNLGEDEVEKTSILLRAYEKKINLGVPTSQNLAKQIAEHLRGKIPVIIGSGILSQVARRYKTQINENAQSMAVFEILPEICHNTIVGFDFPEKLREKIFVIILQSKYDHTRNILRQKIIMQILQKKGISYESLSLNPQGGKLSEVLHNILFADYVSYYLAILNNADPTEIEMIDFLKNKLSETVWEMK